VRNVEWMTMGDSLEGIDVIKQHIMDHGAIGTAFCVDLDFLYNSSAEWYQYQPPSTKFQPNHAVAIIGWNDRLYTQAPLPGAWLCKNSWGNTIASPYFWISYYDKWGPHHPEMGAVSFFGVDTLVWDNIYSYDYHGWRDTRSDCSEAFNAFEAVSGGHLQAISFYTATESVDFTAVIFDQFSGGILSDTLRMLAGHYDCRGFHTVDLDEPLRLTQGDSFFVYLALSDGGQAFDRTSAVSVLLGAEYRATVESKANPGESYLYDGSQWVDFTTVEPTGNFCIKALGQTGLFVNSEPGSGSAPVEVAFSAESQLDVTSWVWDFGDGDSAFVQNPSHTYKYRGRYMPSCEITFDGMARSCGPENGVIVVADTVMADCCSGISEQTVCITISAVNTVAAHHFTIPIECIGDFHPVCDSFSTVGCRTEQFDQIDIVNFDPMNSRFTVAVSSSAEQGAPPVPPGEGPILRLFFTIPSSCTGGDRTGIVVDGYGSQLPKIAGEGLQYTCTGVAGEIAVEGSCCVGIRGNINNDSDDEIDISDLTFLVGYMFRSGPEPTCMEEANVDGTGGVDIADLTQFVAYMFKNGPEPVACPITK
jgi:hypothetical protein